ncbi:MAG: hypothetical protein SV583_04720 [Pseudomonadota bacterium]|nr:hypothetical protein [Pseudomonadota bacterium]
MAQADSASADRIYHPYVQPLEKEIELRTLFEDDRRGEDRWLTKLGYGRSLGSRWAVEGYLIGARTTGESFSLAAYELEALWQVTEQGEYAADWGALFELEKEDGADIWEASAALLSERQWGRYVGTANLRVGYEGGGDIDNEWESALALQGRYRWRPQLEPALEFHAAQDLLAVGPVLLGTVRLQGALGLRWEAGLFAGLDGDSPDLTARAVLEYEFF